MKKHRLLLSITLGLVQLGIAVVLISLQGCGADDGEKNEVNRGKGLRAHPEFEGIEGWDISEIKVYKGDELYGPINGEADRFIHFGFREAYFFSYSLDGGDGVIDVQIYRMDTADSAYGIFTMYDSARPLAVASTVPPGFFKNVSALSRISESTADIVKGVYFVRLSQHNMEPDLETLSRIGQPIVTQLDGAEYVPDFLKLHPPDLGWGGTLRYFRKWESYREINLDWHENILGLSERTEGIQTTHTKTNDGIQKDKLLIVGYPDKTSAQAALQRTTEFFRNEGYETSETEDGSVLIKKEGNAFAQMSVVSEYLYGIYDISSPEVAERLMRNTLESINSSKGL